MPHIMHRERETKYLLSPTVKVGINCFCRFLLVALGRKPLQPHFHGHNNSITSYWLIPQFKAINACRQREILSTGKFKIYKAAQLTGNQWSKLSPCASEKWFFKRNHEFVRINEKSRVNLKSSLTALFIWFRRRTTLGTRLEQEAFKYSHI